MIWWMFVIYVFDYVGPQLYTSYILRWLIIKFLNKISFTYQKKKKKKSASAGSLLVLFMEVW